MTTYTALNNQKNRSQKYGGISTLGCIAAMEAASLLMKYNDQDDSSSVKTTKEDSVITTEGDI